MKRNDTKHSRGDCYRMWARAAVSAFGLAASGELTLTMWPSATRLLDHAADAVLDEIDRRLDGYFSSMHSGFLLRDAMERSGVSEEEFLALPEHQREAVKLILAEMIYDELPDHDPDGDDGLVVTAFNVDRVLEEMERDKSARAEAAATVEAAVDMDRYLIPVAEAFEGGTYEILIGTGVLGWSTARLEGRKWRSPEGAFIAYIGSVKEVRAVEAHVRDTVQSLFDEHLRGAGKGWSDESIAEILSDAAWSASAELLGGFMAGSPGGSFASLRRRITDTLIEDSFTAFAAVAPSSNAGATP